MAENNKQEVLKERGLHMANTRQKFVAPVSKVDYNTNPDEVISPYHSTFEVYGSHQTIYIRE